MTTSILAIEDPIFNWVFDHIPTIGTVIILMFITAWLTWKVREMFTHYRDRLVKVEHDTSDLKSDIRSIKKKVNKLDRKVSRIVGKLDKLIVYLTSTKRIDKDVLK